MLGTLLWENQVRTRRDLSPNLTFSLLERPQECEGTSVEGGSIPPLPLQELTGGTSTGTTVKTKNPK